MGFLGRDGALAASVPSQGPATVPENPLWRRMRPRQWPGAAPSLYDPGATSRVAAGAAGKEPHETEFHNVFSCLPGLGAGGDSAVSRGLSPFAAELAQIAQDAGRLILKHYARGAESGIEAAIKDDASPVTAADIEAEALIEAALARLAPDIPVIGEEAMAAGATPAMGPRFFLVDPLDGTKEFLKRNGEFTVNIALIENGTAICGVVLAPAKGRAFVGEAGHGAFELAAPEDLPLDPAQAQAIRARAAPAEGLVVIASRTHRDAKTDEYLAAYRVAHLLAAGSSLKFCLLATGEADLYPRHGPTMEWDTAAGQAVLEAAGGAVTTFDGAQLLYGKRGAGFRNPHFVARGLASGRFPAG